MNEWQNELEEEKKESSAWYRKQKKNQQTKSKLAVRQKFLLYIHYT